MESHPDNGGKLEPQIFTCFPWGICVETVISSIVPHPKGAHTPTPLELKTETRLDASTGNTELNLQWPDAKLGASPAKQRKSLQTKLN